MGSVKTILLTGATGYLGSNLAKALVEAGYKLVILIRPTSNTTRLSSILPYIKYYGVDDYNLNQAFTENKIDGVLHTAASYGRQAEKLEDIFKANLLFPVALLDLCKKNNVKYFINTGTSLPPTVNWYSLSKNQFSDVLKMNSDTINIIDLKLEYFYGPGDDTSKFITFLLDKLLLSEKHIALSEGTQFRDFIYIKDAVNAVLMLFEKIGQFTGYNDVQLGSGKAYQLKDIAETLKTKVNSLTQLNFGALPMRQGEVMHSVANIDLLTSLGWKTNYTLEQGITETIEIEKSLRHDHNK